MLPPLGSHSVCPNDDGITRCGLAVRNVHVRAQRAGRNNQVLNATPKNDLHPTPKVAPCFLEPLQSTLLLSLGSSPVANLESSLSRICSSKHTTATSSALQSYLIRGSTSAELDCSLVGGSAHSRNSVLGLGPRFIVRIPKPLAHFSPLKTTTWKSRGLIVPNFF